MVGLAQPTLFPTKLNAAPDVLVTQGIACLVEVFSLTSDHNPILVYIATQHATPRGKKKVIDWDRYGPALCSGLPPAGPLDSVRLLDEAVAGIEEAIISAIGCLLYTSRCV